MSRTTIVHFALDSDTSGFFPQLGKLHDRDAYRMIFATLRPIDPKLRAYMDSVGVETFSCNVTSRLMYPLAMLRLARFLRREHVHILHAHLFDPSVVGLVTAWFVRTPVRIVTRHYSDYHTRIHKRWHVKLDQLCTALSHRVIAVSKHTAEHLIDVESAPAAKVRVVLNGIDFERVRNPRPETRDRIRREFLPNDGYLLVIVARLHPEKGHTYLFHALPEVRKRMSRPVVLIVAGKGPFDEPYRAEVRTLGVDEMVHFAGFRDDISDVIAAADLMVLPSVAEAFGLAVSEAIYLGTPVISTRVGGIPEIVDDGVDGVLVPPSDAAALADAIVSLLNDHERRARMAGAGRDKVVTNFKFEDMLRRYEAIYQELVH